MRNSKRNRKRRGATMVLIAFLLVVLVGMVSFGLEVGRMYLVRAQLQTAVDAGALAASLQLADTPDDTDAAVAAAQQFVQLNSVGWFSVVPTGSIIAEPGVWDTATHSFTVSTTNADSVRVAAQVDNEPLFFARVLGHSDFRVPRAAVAQGGGRDLDAIMALDLSGSMGQQGRIEALHGAAPTFLDVIEDVGDNDRVGVMGYGAVPSQYDPAAEGHSGTPYLNSPANLYPPDSDWVSVLEAHLTFDFDYLRNSVLIPTTLQANKYQGWTPVGAALRDSTHYLHTNARDGVEKAIVLMSDGHANKPDGNGPGYARSMAQYAAGLDIKVYTISLGNAADEALMQDIADITKAEHFVAAGTSQAELTVELREAFRNIANAIKRTQLVQ